MRGNVLSVVAMLAVGALVWVITAWPSPGDDSALEPFQPAPIEPAAPTRASIEAARAEPPPAAPAPAPPSQPSAAAPEPAADPAAPAPDPEVNVARQMFSEDQGPVDEYKRQYESEPRDSAASAVETTIRSAFAPSDGAPELFKSVLCRQSICKLELRWSTDRNGAYIAGITRALQGMEPMIAVTPAGPMGEDWVRPLEVYLKRAQPSAAN